MESLDKLGRRIDHIQYEEIKEIKTTVNTMQVEMATNNLLTKQAVEASKELSVTMSGVRETMVIMAENMKQSNKEISENMISLKENVMKLEDKVDDKFDSVNSKIKEIDEEGKFNVRRWVLGNLPTIIISLAFAGYAIVNFVK